MAKAVTGREGHATSSAPQFALIKAASIAIDVRFMVDFLVH
jgi:hypothetical protein